MVSVYGYIHSMLNNYVVSLFIFACTKDDLSLVLASRVSGTPKPSNVTPKDTQFFVINA